jgi:uncharacterized protein (TIGR01319 family)
MSAFIESETLLAVDVGSVNTRASLFDVVDGRYRLVATGRAPSTAGGPLFDVSEGVRSALEQVQVVTGRKLVDEAETLIMPATAGGTGVDVFVATASAGPRARTLLVGLMPGVSLESARRLAGSTYLDLVGEIGLLDRRRDDERLDMIVRAQPDLVLLVGGTDGGATESLEHWTSLLGLGLALLPAGDKPRLVFAGNQRVAAKVSERLSAVADVTLAPNVRPTLEAEEIATVRQRLSEVVQTVRSSRISGLEELRGWSGGQLMNTADGFGRVIRYLSTVYDSGKGVLGIDLGASQTTIAVGFGGDLRLHVRTDLGLGSAVTGVLRYATAAEIGRWLPIQVSEPRIRDYIFNKALHPGVVPVQMEELHMEYALAREVMRLALASARLDWPPGRGGRTGLRLPLMEPILASGGVLSRAPRPGYAALAILDGLQPTGVATLILDPHNLTPALGVAAGVVPLATVQALDSGSYVSLGTVVAPVGGGRPGRPMLRLRLDREGGEVTEGHLRYGQLSVLPLRQGEFAKLTLRPERGFDVGFGGPGKAGAVRVSGGAVGVILDGRGRPLELTRDSGRWRDLVQKWLWDIGALE